MGIRLKQATTADCDVLFDWANEVYVRLNSFNTEIITYEDHCKWFNKKIHSDDSKIYIAYDEEFLVGQIRVDKIEDKAWISYSVDNAYRGKGYGTQIIQLLLSEIDHIFHGEIKGIIGKVKPQNLASKAIFEKLGFEITMKTDNFIEYFYNVKNRDI